MMRPERRNRNGFTLPEVMVSASIMIVILGSVFGTIIPLYRGIETAETAALLFETQSRIVDYVTRDLRACVGAKVENAGKRIRLTMPTGYESSGTLPSPPSVTGGLATYTTPVVVVYETTSGRFTRTSSTLGSQTLATLSNRLSVSFSPTILTGSSVPPVTVTVDVNSDTRIHSSPAAASASMSRTVQPKLKATILP